jgi:hypothetical protein
MSKLTDDFKLCWKKGVPLVLIRSVDHSATIKKIAAVVPEHPMIMWDSSEGFKALNDSGETVLNTAIKHAGTTMTASDPPYEFVKVALFFTKKTLFFMLNVHAHLNGGTFNDAALAQALWNLRDKYESASNQRMVIALDAEARLPIEIRQDFVILDDPLPSNDELWAATEKILDTVKIKIPTDEHVKSRIVTTLKGLTLYAAKQTLALSTTPNGLDLERLWEQKKRQIEMTKGLMIYEGKETFQDVVGVSFVRQYITQIFNGRDRPTGIVFLDEIEKMMAGIQGDSTGASQEQLGEFLKWTQNNKIPAMMFVGHAGCSKSYLAKTAAAQFGVPEIELDIAAMKGSLLGQTGEQTREAFRTVLAICKPLLIATSNSMGILPPELKRRFSMGTWFFDLPTQVEREAVWRMYIKNLGLDPNQAHPLDDGWTQAEIAVCCLNAWQMNVSLKTAGMSMTPIVESDPGAIEKLRKTAHKRFINAAEPGKYIYSKINAIDLSEAEKNQIKSGVGQA